MNEFLTIAQKTGAWIWYQKEKIVLLVLVAFCCVRAYQVVYGKPPDLPEGPPPKPADDIPGLPDARAEKPRPTEFQSLVQRNPFSVYGITTGGTTDTEGDERIDLNLLRIVSWHDDSYRAEMQRSNETRPKLYEEGEVFGDFELINIDPEANTVTVYAREYDRNFTLAAQQGAA